MTSVSIVHEDSIVSTGTIDGMVPYHIDRDHTIGSNWLVDHDKADVSPLRYIFFFGFVAPDGSRTD